MDTLRVKCISWNVQTGWPEQNLSQLLGIEKLQKKATNKTAETPNIYIISLQEVRSQPQNMVLDYVFAEPWTKQFMDELSPFGYVRIGGERLQGCVTSVFIERTLLCSLRDIRTSFTRTGMGGYWGNKGAIALRFSVLGVSVCCVNSHLAPHDSGYSSRVAQYDSILQYTTFTESPPTTSILYHDYVFWMGDLNFRMDASLSAEEINARISSGDFKSLLEMDELKKAQRERDAFEPFVEGEITFPPTYKYKEKSTGEYDLKRRPAYTDRILHHVTTDAYEDVKLSVSQHLYTSYRGYTQSDHKPVTAEYTFKVRSGVSLPGVTLTPVGEWRACEGGVATISVQTGVSVDYFDYVALFKSNFSSMEQYVSYCYLPPFDNETETATVQVEMRDDLIQESGSYCLVYISKRHYCCLGTSQPFEVLPRLPL